MTASADTLAALPFHAAAAFPDHPAQRARADDGWHDLDHRAQTERITRVAAGLVALGVRPGDRVAVLLETRPEWAEIEFGAAVAGAVVVPIYPTSSADECEWVLADSGAVLLVCEDTAQLAKVAPLRDRLPALRHVVVVDASPGEPDLAELAARGTDDDRAEAIRRAERVRPADPALIIYTSGTTGRPRGCVLSHRAMTACGEISRQLGTVRPDDVIYLFLPLAHVYAQVVLVAANSMGATVAFCSRGTAAIVPDLAEVRPTTLPAVPRVFEKVYTLVTARLDPAERRELVRIGLAARRGDPLSDADHEAYQRAEAGLFGGVRALVGGRLRMAISGAAPIAPEILEFFAAAGVPVLEGWGMSETAATGTLNPLTAPRYGTIGPAVPGAEVRVSDDGELLVRGPMLFDGYWNNPEATARALVDGWLHTGDLATVDDDGYVTIVGRTKDIIITAGGKNIAPANLENDLRRSPWISQVVLHGDRRPYLVALITLDPETVLPWARAHGLPEDLTALAAEPAVRDLVQQAVDQANTAYSRVGQIKKFVLLGHDLSQRNGEITPTLKVRRAVVHRRYAEQFDRLYDTPRSEAPQ